MLYKFRFKDGAEPKSELVEADSMVEAEKMCREWAGSKERVKYIGVREAVMLRQDRAGKADVYPKKVV